jgi:hypothetical protein
VPLFLLFFTANYQRRSAYAVETLDIWRQRCKKQRKNSGRHGRGRGHEPEDGMSKCEIIIDDQILSIIKMPFCQVVSQRCIPWQSRITRSCCRPSEFG